MATANDDFNRADAGTLGSNWTTQTNEVTCGVTSNKVARTNIFNFNGNWYNAVSFTGDHYSQAVCQVNNADAGIAVRCRCQPSAQSYYAGGADANQFGTFKYRIWKNVAGTLTSLAAHGSQETAAGDVVRLEVQGTSLKLFVNSVELLSTTDSALSGGAPGLNADINPTGTAVWDDWVGSDLDASDVLSAQAIF